MTDNPDKKKHKPIKDRFRKARGGSSHFLDIHCARCGKYVLLYQKDGPGSLIRLYLDRILEPADKAQWQHLAADKKAPTLICSSCGALIGTPMVYKSESRRAIRLQRGACVKKKSDGTYPPDKLEDKDST